MENILSLLSINAVLMKKLLLLLALTCTLVPVYSQERGQTRSMSDKYKKIYYTSIEDAERKLIQYHEERRSDEIRDNNHCTDCFPYDMFKSLVKSDERTLTYDFNLSEIDEILSADGNVKLYKWIYGVYATTGADSDGILTYMSKGRYLYCESEEGDEGYYDLVVPTDTYKIETVTLDEGYPVYLFFAGHRTASSYDEWVSAYILSGSSLVPYHLFVFDGEITTTVQRYTGSGGCYDGSIDYKNGLLMVSREGHCPLDTCPPFASGFQDIYKFNGRRFLYSETKYDEEVPLNIKLRNFKYNIVCLEFLPWKIRIDYMPDGTYRYASWKNREMSEVPDITINNGEYRFTKVEKGWGGKLVEFTFTNKEYEYIVSYEIVEYNRFNDLTPISLVVKKNGKVLMNVIHKKS